MPYDRMTAKADISVATLKVLQAPRPWPWVRDAAFDWALILLACTAACAWPGVFTIVLAFLVIGNRQHALALLGHDGTHFTITKRRRLNDALTDLLTWLPLGLTGDGYRALHIQHHQHLGTEQDPEVVYKGVLGEHWDLPTGLGQIAAKCLLDLVGGGIKDYRIILAYSVPSDPALAANCKIRRRGFHITVIGLACAGAWAVSPAILIAPMLWYFSLPTAFMMFFRVRLWLEHQGTDTAHRLHLNFWQGGLLAPHLCWHHYEHHMWPSVPYASLPKLRELMPGEPIMTLRDLIAFYRNAVALPAGTPTAVSRA